VTPAQQADSRNTFFEDGWIETKVQGRIAFNEHLNLGNFDVEVRDGVCILTGEVISQEQKMLAAEIAEETEGVKSVDNLVTVVAWKTAALD
jgi:hyperosmotically inducible periplasmic protein